MVLVTWYLRPSSLWIGHFVLEILFMASDISSIQARVQCVHQNSQEVYPTVYSAPPYALK